MKETREQRRSWENHRQSWGGGQLATQLDVWLRLWQAEKSYKAMPVRLHPPPHASLLLATLKAKGTPNTTNKTNPGTLLGVARMAEKGQRVPGCNAACTVSPTVPLNPDRPALPETNMAMYHHVGSCFHRNLPGLWTTLCKNYSFF